MNGNSRIQRIAILKQHKKNNDNNKKMVLLKKLPLNNEKLGKGCYTSRKKVCCARVLQYSSCNCDNFACPLIVTSS